MSTPVTEKQADEPTEKPDKAAPKEEFTPISDQAEFNKRVAERLAREREKYADYKDLKAKASQFEEQENAKASDVERLAKKLEESEREKASLHMKLLKADVASEKGVPARLLAGSTREELEEAADALLEFRGAKKPDPVKSLTPGGETKPERSVAAGAAMFAAKKKPSQN